MKTLDEITYIEQLPPNIASDAGVQDIGAALDTALQTMPAVMERAIILPAIDGQPESILDALAWQRHVDGYRQDLTIEQKRALVKQSTWFHRHAGTRGALEDLINIIWGGTAVIHEWFEMTPRLTPGTILITLSDALAEVDLNLFVQSLAAVKRHSTHIYLQTAGSTVEIDAALTARVAVLLVQQYHFEV